MIDLCFLFVRKHIDLSWVRTKKLGIVTFCTKSNNFYNFCTNNILSVCFCTKRYKSLFFVQEKNKSLVFLTKKIQQFFVHTVQYTVTLTQYSTAQKLHGPRWKQRFYLYPAVPFLFWSSSILFLPWIYSLKLYLLSLLHGNSVFLHSVPCIKNW